MVEDKNMETGTISEGNTVFVTRLECSTMEPDARRIVSLNSSQGSMPAKRNKE